MHRERFLNLLDPDARRYFERARNLARRHGGLLSPLHLLVALLESNDQTTSGVLKAFSEELSARFPDASRFITVPKETQNAMAEAGRIAGEAGRAQAGPGDLLRAVKSTETAGAAISSLSSNQPGLEEWLERAAESLDSGRCAIEEPAKALPPVGPPQTARLTGALAEFCSDLASESTLSTDHPFVGRAREITAVLETLCRKLKNNPLLIGKPGVGKTALVAAVSMRLMEGQVPLRLRGKRVLEVSRLRLLADAKFAGEIEQRLKRLLEEVRGAGDVILFFDEIHTLLNAGQTGTGDVANLLKTTLSKGEIMCIGATTLGEYYKYVARDEALARRFSNITIEEPSRDETGLILSHSRSSFESYHGVTIDEEVISMIVDLADRYMHSRCFPDKAFDLLDRAAAKAALSGQERLTREDVTGTLSETTGLPLEIMDEDPAQRLARLEDFLNAAVPGQRRAAHDVARVVRIAKLRLELRPEQPDGVFLFVGPEGVGKHEMAMALATFLYGSTQKMIAFDMSQFSEAHSLSRLIGAEPGYVGYGDRSGLLSKAAEDNPHAVLYFKNIDVAHPLVQQFLGEAFEQGRFTDASGTRISLSNTTVVMSPTQPADSSRGSPIGFFARTDQGEARRSPRATGSLTRESGLMESLASTIDEIIEFQVLDRDATEKIVGERLSELCRRLEAAQPVRIEMAPGIAGLFAERLASERKSLAQLERLLQEAIVLPFSHLQLSGANTGRSIVRVRVEGDSIRLDTSEAG